MLSATDSALTASMLRDLENGGPIEADHIVGFVLEKARVHGVDEGMLAVAYTHLKAYEVRWIGRRPDLTWPTVAITVRASWPQSKSASRSILGEARNALSRHASSLLNAGV